jgi:dihydroorotate dehydrogenase (fumarate)
MVQFSTEYMGLSLSNPLVVASSGLTNTFEGVLNCANGGAGAVVLKSLFEEQMQADTQDLEEHSWILGHPEAFEYVRGMGMDLGPREYLKLIEESKKAVSIPIIASLNCISPKWWVSYARQIEAAGADGLELNISVMPSSPERTSKEIEELHLRIFEEVQGGVGLPIAVKLGPYFTSMARIAEEFSRRGAAALVLFNRFYQLDIDTAKLEITKGYRFSTPEEMNVTLRWIALLAGRTSCDLAASTGIHDGAGAVKQLLAGARVVQLCSTLYINGMNRIGEMLKEIESWMEEHGYSSLDEIRGKLSQTESDRPELYERLQYIKALVGIE